MKTIIIFVEDTTELNFCQNILSFYLLSYGLIVEARRTETSKGNRGGVPNYEKVKNLILKCDIPDPFTIITTMID